jgi:hypothetical protein
MARSWSTKLPLIHRAIAQAPTPSLIETMTSEPPLFAVGNGVIIGGGGGIGGVVGDGGSGGVGGGGVGVGGGFASSAGYSLFSGTSSVSKTKIALHATKTSADLMTLKKDDRTSGDVDDSDGHNRGGGDDDSGGGGDGGGGGGSGGGGGGVDASCMFSCLILSEARLTVRR